MNALGDRPPGDGVQLEVGPDGRGRALVAPLAGTERTRIERLPLRADLPRSVDLDIKVGQLRQDVRQQFHLLFRRPGDQLFIVDLFAGKEEPPGVEAGGQLVHRQEDHPQRVTVGRQPALLNPLPGIQPVGRELARLPRLRPGEHHGPREVGGPHVRDSGQSDRQAGDGRAFTRVGFLLGEGNTGNRARKEQQRNQTRGASGQASQGSVIDQMQGSAHSTGVISDHGG